MCFTKRRSTFSQRRSIHVHQDESSEDVVFFDRGITKHPGFATHPKFLIVGAGVAGIACAVGLIKEGFRDVVLVEAENRIGGRIHTIAFADNVVDLGAQWCHGETENVVFEIVKNMDLLETSGNIYVTFQCIRSNGEVVPESIVKRLKDILADIFQNRQNSLRDYEGTFGAYLTEQFYNELQKEENADINEIISTEFFENFKKIESSETASGVDEVSARGLDEYWECEGDYMLNWRDKGFLEFIRVLMGADVIGNEFGVLEDRIVFSTRAVEIKWERTDAKVEVKCENMDNEFLVDHVVVTCPLGVLKQCATTMFDPELPPNKLRSIEAIGFGSACKIFLEFTAPFWPNDWSGFTTLWRKEDLTEIRKSKRAWVEDIYGFYRVNCQPRILLGWHVGKHLNEVEKMTNEAVKDGCLYLLRRFLKGWSIPEPLNIVKSTWNQNPNFLGSFSFRSMDTEKIGASAIELAQPITVLAEAPVFQNEDAGNSAAPPLSVKPLVLFAGEATSPHHYGTVHGAVESGMREAARLAGYYSLDL